jgi:hypothetical protein
MTEMTRTLTIDPHHPTCCLGNHDGPWAGLGLDPERCCYCAASARNGFRSEQCDPLDYRYGGPGCGCAP